MPVAFGFSAGDFLAALKLVGTVTDALRESSHASSGFRSLINELYALESALLRVKRLDSDVGQTVDIIALRQAASQCQRTIDAFYKKVQKYQPHLQSGGTDSSIKDAWAKVKWAVCKKDDLETFRAEIRGHTGSIEVLLLALHMEATTIQTHNQETQSGRLARRIQDFSCQTMGMLSSITGSVAQGVQQGKALLDSSTRILQTNLQIFQILHDIQHFILRIPGQIQRQQPVHFIDPCNREYPFHLEFVRSPDALLAVLKDNLKESGCGPAMIDQGDFKIEELGSKTVIDLTEPWDCCFFPGQRVAMSMVFKRRRDVFEGEADDSSCPRCDQTHKQPRGTEVTCISCGAIFRRLEEVIEEDRDISQTTTRDTTSVALPRPRKIAKSRDGDVSASLRKFRRIQLLDMSIIPKTIPETIPSPRYYSTSPSYSPTSPVSSPSNHRVESLINGGEDTGVLLGGGKNFEYPLPYDRVYEMVPSSFGALAAATPSSTTSAVLISEKNQRMLNWLNSDVQLSRHEHNSYGEVCSTYNVYGPLVAMKLENEDIS